MGSYLLNYILTTLYVPQTMATTVAGLPIPQWAIMAVIIGFSIALFLQVMRTRLPWWPFHPLAFAVTSSWEINLVWMPLFIAWVLKVVILRYGGRQGFSKSVPFFMGLIMGQFVVGSLWNVWGVAMDLPTYQFWE